MHLAARHLAVAEAEGVLVGAEDPAVAHADGRDDEAELEGELPAQRADAREEVAAVLGLLVDEGQQAIAELDLQRIEREELLDLLGRRRLGGAAPMPRRGGVDGPSAELIRAQAEQRGGHEEGQQGQPREQRDDPENARGHAERPRPERELPDELLAQLRLGGGAGDHDARRGRDDQRGDLGDQAVADGEDRVGGERVVDRQAVLEHADGEARRGC